MRHPSPNNLSAFVRGELPETELLNVGDHISECGECAQESERAVSLPTRREWQEWRPDPLSAGHIDDDQLLAYVRGQCSAADRRTVEEHVSSCRLCREDLADLQNFQACVAPSAGKVYTPSAGATSTTVTLGELFRRAMGMRWLPAAAAAGIAGLAVFYLGVEPLRIELAKERTQTQQLAAQVRQSDDLRRELEKRLASAPTNAVDPRVVELGKQLAAARAKESELQQRLLALQKATPTPAPGAPATQVADAVTERALKSGNLLIAADVRSLQGERGRLLGGNDDGAPFSPSRPVGTVVRGQRPVFRWRPFAGATSYRVMVFDEAFNEVGRGEVQGQDEWRPETALARGKTYHWEIVALRNGEEVERTPRPPAPPARFRVLAAGDAAALAQLKLSTPLERGVRYAGFGLLDDAQRELETAVEEAATPAERKQVDRLLNQLQAVRAPR